MAKEKPSSYCEFVATLEKNHVDRVYHDTQYGFPVRTDHELFGRLILEINQAGLNWTTILKKQKNFRRAYSQFKIEEVAAYGQTDIDRLLNDAGIIRNRLKINAAIYNANSILELKKEFGSFKKWLDRHHPLCLKDWVKLFKKTFKFTGPEITNEFLMSTGYLRGAHIEECEIFELLQSHKPRWSDNT